MKRRNRSSRLFTNLSRQQLNFGTTHWCDPHELLCESGDSSQPVPATSPLKWTQGLNNLDFFSFVETSVEDGDLSPLLLLPTPRHVGTMGKKHYNYKCDDPSQLLAERHKSHN